MPRSARKIKINLWCKDYIEKSDVVRMLEKRICVDWDKLCVKGKLNSIIRDLILEVQNSGIKKGSADVKQA